MFNTPSNLLTPRLAMAYPNPQHFDPKSNLSQLQPYVFGPFEWEERRKYIILSDMMPGPVRGNMGFMKYRQLAH